MRLPQSLHKLKDTLNQYLYGYQHVERDLYSRISEMTATQVMNYEQRIVDGVRRDLGEHITERVEVVRTESFVQGSFNYEATLFAMNEEDLKELLFKAYEQGAVDLQLDVYNY